jgi:hypothetical protein
MWHTRSDDSEQDSEGEEFEVTGPNCSAFEYVMSGFRYRILSDFRRVAESFKAALCLNGPWCSKVSRSPEHYKKFCRQSMFANSWIFLSWTAPSDAWKIF